MGGRFAPRALWVITLGIYALQKRRDKAARWETSKRYERLREREDPQSRALLDEARALGNTEEKGRKIQRRQVTGKRKPKNTVPLKGRQAP